MATDTPEPRLGSGESLHERSEAVSSPSRACHVLNLPYDIVYLIFTFAWTEAGQKRDDFPIKISHVCRLWRQYALDTPGFWTSLKFEKPIPEIKKYRTWLERSKDAPFDIEIGWRPFIGASMKHIKAIMGLVFPHVQRLRSLKVSDVPFKIRVVIFDRLNGVQLPLLETLRVKRGWATDEKPDLTDRKFKPFRHGEPINLKHVGLREIPYGYVIHRFKHLRTLEIINTTIFGDSSRDNAKTVQGILSALPDLRILSIDSEHSSGPCPENPTLPLTTHSSLEELSFRAPESDITAIVCALRLPSLRQLCNISGGEARIDPCCLPIMVQARQSHSYPNLLRLQLYGRQVWGSSYSVDDSLNMGFFERALAGLPQLESLVLESLDLDHGRHLMCPSKSCPRLERMRLAFCSGLALKELRAVIQSRRDPKGLGSNTLEYVHVEDKPRNLKMLRKEAEEHGLGGDPGFNIAISNRIYPYRIIVIGEN